MFFLFRHHDRADDDNDQHRSAFVTAANLICEGDRHLPGHVLRVRLRRALRVCCGQLHILGGKGKEEEEGEETEGNIKGIRDAGSTADFRILFEVFKIKILKFENFEHLENFGIF